MGSQESDTTEHEHDALYSHREQIFAAPFYLNKARCGYVCMKRNQSIFTGGSEVKASVCSVRDPGSIPGLGRSPGEGNGTPLQCSCLENPMDGGAW